MERITMKNLESLVRRINEATGSPATPYTKTDDGKFRANIGNYHLDGAYGGWSLERMSSSGGGVSDVFWVGHVSKRELYGLMRAFLAGVEAVKH